MAVMRKNWPNCILRGEEGRATTFHRAARRERAHRVFQSIQAVAGFACSWNLGVCYYVARDMPEWVVV